MFGTNRAPVLHQDQHYLEMDWNELPLEPHNLGVPSGASKTIFELMVRLAQSIHLSRTATNNVSKMTVWDSTWPMSPKSCIRCVQNYFWANGTFGPNHAPILHQDQHYLETDWNKLPLEPHNQECHWMRPKRFLSLWYIWRKVFNYLALTLTLS
jgi:hypothetical protein